MDKKLKKILIVEDNELLIKMYTLKLSTEGFSVDQAHDGKEALTKLQETAYDIVLLDIIIPIIDGFKVLEKLRTSDWKNKNIPVIVFTNLGNVEDINKSRALGASDYLVKATITPNEIVGKLNKHLASIMDKPMKERKNRILMIEDDVLFLKMYESKLTIEGFSVDTANNSLNALQKLQFNDYDLILLDLLLINISGFEILKQLRTSNWPTNKKPVIIFTNLDNTADIMKAREIGANDYLIKATLSPNQLVEKLNEYLTT